MFICHTYLISNLDFIRTCKWNLTTPTSSGLKFLYTQTFRKGRQSKRAYLGRMVLLLIKYRSLLAVLLKTKTIIQYSSREQCQKWIRLMKFKKNLTIKRWWAVSTSRNRKKGKCQNRNKSQRRTKKRKRNLHQLKNNDNQLAYFNHNLPL